MSKLEKPNPVLIERPTDTIVAISIAYDNLLNSEVVKVSRHYSTYESASSHVRWEVKKRINKMTTTQLLEKLLKIAGIDNEY